MHIHQFSALDDGLFSTSRKLTSEGPALYNSSASAVFLYYRPLALFPSSSIECEASCNIAKLQCEFYVSSRFAR